MEEARESRHGVEVITGLVSYEEMRERGKGRIRSLRMARRGGFLGDVIGRRLQIS
jgi:hypothetical protein